MRYRKDKGSLRYGQAVSALVTGLFGVAVSVFVFGWLLSKFDAGGLIMSALSILFICGCSYTVGMIGACIEKKSSIALGLMCGLGCFTVLMFAGTILSYAMSELSITTKLILSLVSGIFGGLSAGSKKK